MKIAITPINVAIANPEVMGAIARKAEEVGVESVWTFEHVIVPVKYQSAYPYSSSGKMPATPETPFVDPLIAIAFAAGCTSTLRFGTGVNILPQANPLLLAKQVASIDVVSGGRMMFGVGIGWLREEFEALGVPFERRGARFDDYVLAMKKVWSGEVVEHDSEFIHWQGFKSHPLPVQRPHPPIIIGGTSKRALRRVVEHAQGWYAPNRSAKHMAEMLADLREVAAEAGRDMSSIEITATWRYDRQDTGALAEYEALGVDRLMIPTYSLPDADPIVGLERLRDEVLKDSPAPAS